MNTWTTTDARALAAPEEVQIAPHRADGTLRPPTTIWIVGAETRVFVRSTDGHAAAWFRSALVNTTAVITAGGRTYEVTFTEAPDTDLPTADGAYRAKCRRYASIVDHLLGPDPRASTLEVHPA